MLYLIRRHHKLFGVGAKEGKPGGVVCFTRSEHAHRIAESFGGRILAMEPVELKRWLLDQGLVAWVCDDQGFMSLWFVPPTVKWLQDAASFEQEKEKELLAVISELFPIEEPV